MAITRSRGKLKGRTPKLTARQQAEPVQMHATGDYTIAELLEVFSVGRATVYRVLECAAINPTGTADAPTLPDHRKRAFLNGLDRGSLCGMHPSRVYVRGLPLPVLLIEAMASGAWPAQDDMRLREIMPWFEDPLDLLADVHEMRRESAPLDWMTEDSATADFFRLARGSRAGDLVELPWLDADLAVLIGVNRNPGDDVALALDYRTGSDDPSVVASDWWTEPHQCAWRIVAPTFSAFAAALGVDVRRRYPYVGPEEIRVQIRSQGRGHPITSSTDLAEWLARQASSERGEPFTFVIDESTTLRLAPRRSEHVVCAGGAPVQSAGEITFEPDGDGWRVSEISNQSTGYCPEPDSYAAVQAALDTAGIEHPGRFTVPIVFRRCGSCGQLNIVKDDHYFCAMCDESLPAAWNADASGEPAPRPRNGTAVGDIVSGTVVADERPFGPRIRLDGDASMPAHIRDFPWKGKRSDAVRIGRHVTAEVVSIDDAAGRIWLSLAATEDSELWRYLKGLRAGDVLTGTVADIRSLAICTDVTAEAVGPALAKQDPARRHR
ncbi:helix-turn-helix domain-containing protein [Actinocorallia populi]|uniref:helix-turn-helix domain-containing protein n=1 Tax=Actinocorallia populi TaxID=2079200 RepID=UPI0018E4DF28|nr:helix-turn-helix domain-containing protein [Actinocorallia populi]